MIKVGTSRVDITPPIGMPHANWGSSAHQVAEGIDMPMYCYAMYLESESSENKVVILDFDLCSMSEEIDGMVRDAVVSSLDIPRENIRICLSHTHAGPPYGKDNLNGAGWITEGIELINPYYDSFPEKISRAIDEAVNSVVDCNVSYGNGRSDININRRPADKNGALFTGRNWDGPVDHSVDVIGFDAADGTPVATIVGYACHPHILGPDNRLISPDYPGHMRKTVEEIVGGRCIFFQGYAGNQGPVHTFVGEVEAARKAGKLLGLEASKVRLSIDPFEREEKLVEIIPAGADLGMYEDVPVNTPNDDLVISNTYVDLPTLDFPSYEEASKVFELALEELKKARESGNQEEIKKMVSKSKRANFTRRNSLRSKDGKVNIWIQTIKIGDIVLQGIPLEPFIEYGNKIKSLNPNKKIVLSGYTNGIHGYLPTAIAYEEGGYETRNTPLSPESEELITQICDAEIKNID
ncbi:MAG: neutral/alkaline non-lysosomal ceramidase N-terminal domain-containing protein [Chloroflexota bacterium]|nr:neutral/alkaline non-lysosomal ceramidase N-terminal domain-containing protein [Chloroflexota bacterium]